MLEQTTEEFRESLCRDLNTSLEKIQEDVKILKEWIKTQPHLPQCSTNTLLTTFLVASKNNLEKAKERLDRYYTVRSEIPQFYADRDPLDERLLEVSREVRLFLLPKMTPDGCRVQMVTYATGDIQKYDLTLFAKRNSMLEDVKMHREAFNRGRYVVVDAGNFTLAHALKLTPTLCLNLLHCLQDVLPINIKGIIFINSPNVLHISLKIMKLFMKNKLFQRFHVHREGPEVLQSYFPLDILPKDYGGKGDTSEKLNEDWLACLSNNRDWLLKEGALTVDESKRPQKKPILQTTPSKEVNGLRGHLEID